MKIKLMMVFGTRPEGIKMAPLFHALNGDNERFDTTVVVTGQHREMLDQVLELFDITPDFDLSVMRDGQDLTDVTISIMEKMREIYRQCNPDLVLVHGDTTTTYAAATAAFYQGISVGHVEAGLRTFNLQAPFPEEFNRQVVSKIAEMHFCPTQTSADNLMSEGVDASQIFITGNTVIDSLHWVLRRLQDNAERKEAVVNVLSDRLGFGWERCRYVLVTGHRRENFGDGFISICKAVFALAERFPTTHFVYPVHLNPRVREPVESLLGGVQNIHLIEPLDYEPFVYLLSKCYLVLTDSGGIQEEAPSLGKPVLVMRDVTERPEAVAAGTVKLVGTDETTLTSEVSSLLTDSEAYARMARAHNPYGDGDACARILKSIFGEIYEQ